MLKQKVDSLGTFMCQVFFQGNNTWLDPLKTSHNNRANWPLHLSLQINLISFTLAGRLEYSRTLGESIDSNSQSWKARLK